MYHLLCSRQSKCCQEQREYAVLVPRESWVVREAESRSIRSKTRQKIPNTELQIHSQILSDINSQEGKVTDMAGSRFREEGRAWPELVRSTAFCEVKGKQTLPGPGNRAKQGLEEEKADQPAGNTSCLCSQVVEAVETELMSWDSLLYVTRCHPRFFSRK